MFSSTQLARFGGSGGLFSPTAVALAQINYKQRLKTRMVGYIPKFVPRKAKNCMVSLRSEANTGTFHSHLKGDADRLDTTGRKLQMVRYDEVLGRYAVFKEAKIKGPYMLKSHIQKAAPLPWLTSNQTK
jgi:hypothetical protein